ncbi:domain found in IF2B/IF5-domain-containing protein [Protomyces lactucae-debilis]|uniref:Domain found in IF2B/IF5-domain-containing protein n=1 Tax=Protomyces lactucae-debilis TaxID=2754530 RepID=A0A1Y2FH71_PROLT|nr:domain found in IF2B/IF5-domain-containing protein [Protomyces lactucae-debilis]ORY83290.1 domain found in IF2B/IF5-domain-containing protein [Protomyces lactucae-debilis]
MSDAEQQQLAAEDLAFDPSVKKKKKSTKPKAVKFDQDAANLEEAGDADDVLELGTQVKQTSLGNDIEEGNVQDTADEPAAEQAEEVGEFDFSTTKKKKKKKVIDTAALDALEQEAGTTAGDAADEDDGDATDKAPAARQNKAEGEPWVGSDRDYTFKELLQRLFDQHRVNNPDADSGEKRKYTIVPPNVQREGSKKTCFANVADISKRMHRSPDHVIQFIYAELGTNGSIDGAGRLILKGRFQQKQIETVLRRYISEYVTCKTCRSPDTLLTKENRLFFLDCEQCNSRRSVAGIKAGFSAQIGKRRLNKPAT